MSDYNARKLIKASVLAVLLLTCLCQIGLAAGSSVSVSPQTITASPGDIFTIDIIADPDGSEIYGAEYTLHFDKKLLKVIDQSKGTFLSHDGAEIIEVSNSFNNDIGSIEYGETRMGDPAVIGGVTDPGVLASIRFEAISSGTCDLKLEAMLADSSAQQIDAVVNGGTCSIDGTGETATARETPTSTTTSSNAFASTTASSNAPARQTPEDKGLPGFGIVCSVIGLIAALLVLKRNLNK